MGNIPTAFHIEAPRKQATRKRSPEDISLESTMLLVSTRLTSDSIAVDGPIAAAGGAWEKMSPVALWVRDRDPSQKKGCSELLLQALGVLGLPLPMRSCNPPIGGPHPTRGIKT